ncbi:MAG: hypothetical protein NZL88_11920 [Gaiellaceae bacterium]|nr:hypothetical protein [Gaiellaceae bacterium]
MAGERFDLIVANPPYVAAADPALVAGELRHEPRRALAGGEDGLASLRAVVDGAPAHLAAQGSLIVEHGADQGPAVGALLARAGFVEVRTHRDLAGRERFAAGVLTVSSGTR